MLSDRKFVFNVEFFQSKNEFNLISFRISIEIILNVLKETLLIYPAVNWTPSRYTVNGKSRQVNLNLLIFWFSAL